MNVRTFGAPHFWIAINDAIDRILVTNTIKHDLTDPGETITAVEASSGKPLGTYKLSGKPSPSGVALVLRSVTADPASDSVMAMAMICSPESKRPR